MVVREPVMRVLPELEEGKRVVTVCADEVARGASLLRTWELAWRAERPEDQIREADDREDAHDRDGERQPFELVVELDRRRVPGQQACGADSDDAQRDEKR